MREHLKSLTGIRFVAALWVVVFHQGGRYGLLKDVLSSCPQFVANLVHTGYAAVGVFFVLSGFILAYTYPPGRLPVQQRSFWFARLSRLYPVYFLGLLLCVPQVRRTMLSPGDPGYKVASILTPIFMVQAWDARTALAINPPAWAVSAEIFYYLIFPFAAWWFAGWSRRRLVTAMAALCVLTFACGVWLLLLYDAGTAQLAIDQPQTIFDLLATHPLYRLPEFLFGVLLGQFYLATHASSSRNAPAFVGPWLYVPALTLILVIAGACGPRISLPLLRANATMLFNGLLIYGLACGGGVLHRWLEHPVLVNLGQASYAIYILHVPLIVGLRFVDERSLHWGDRHPLLLLAAYIGLLIPLSLAVYRWVEEPIRLRLRVWWKPTGELAQGLARCKDRAG